MAESTTTDCMYVRMKLDKQTVFVSYTNTDTVGSILERACEALQRDPKTLSVTFDEVVLDHTTKIIATDIVSDSVVTLAVVE